jgi:hypothetical protein
MGSGFQKGQEKSTYFGGLGKTFRRGDTTSGFKLKSDPESEH